MRLAQWLARRLPRKGASAALRLRRRVVDPTFAAVGCPKVGNTWLRVMLGRYVQGLYGMAELPLFDGGDAAMLAAHGCPAIGSFTHAPLEWTGQRAEDLTVANVVEPYRNQRVLLLVRHPLDALVSSYFHEKYRTPRGVGSRTLVEFIGDPVFGLSKLVRFYSLWDQHRALVKELLVWRYEDARRDPAPMLARVAGFLGLPLDEGRLNEAVAFASFENMKRMESSGEEPVYRSSGFGIFATGDRSNPDAYHVRKGRIGGYVDELPSGVVVELEAAIRANMPSAYGYSG